MNSKPLDIEGLTPDDARAMAGRLAAAIVDAQPLGPDFQYLGTLKVIPTLKLSTPREIEVAQELNPLIRSKEIEAAAAIIEARIRGGEAPCDMAAFLAPLVQNPDPKDLPADMNHRLFIMTKALDRLAAANDSELQPAVTEMQVAIKKAIADWKKPVAEKQRVLNEEKNFEREEKETEKTRVKTEAQYAEIRATLPPLLEAIKRGEVTLDTPQSLYNARRIIVAAMAYGIAGPEAGNLLEHIKAEAIPQLKKHIPPFVSAKPDVVIDPAATPASQPVAVAVKQPADDSLVSRLALDSAEGWRARAQVTRLVDDPATGLADSDGGRQKMKWDELVASRKNNSRETQL